ncbi:hypothetical protein DFH07DRAFT_1060290 [Mycena maculata]|uniref:BTB domain-containing protein n=1 Tax=Mycena maculata TaxID=230809 RepID=A0AAD7J969_9AGAR|nr:hypothetical protein DFH07DRAFT_1060290 [Mycena maculata]
MMSKATSESPRPSKLTPTFPLASAPGADVILQTSDGAYFYLHRAILSLVSPVFQTMFSLPQPVAAPEIPIIAVQEDSVLLDGALRFFYPGGNPAVSTIDDLRDIIEVLVSKYDVACVVPIAKQHLARFHSDRPLAVYGIAIAHGWNDAALHAARESLRHPLRIVDAQASPDLNHLPATAYHNLLYYHHLCAAAAKSATEDLRWLQPNDDVWFTCGTCARADAAWYLADGGLHTVRIWFNRYLARLGDVLGETPGIDIVRHKTMSDALMRASKCTTCCEKVFDQLPEFVSTRLAARISETIAEIELKF